MDVKCPGTWIFTSTRPRCSYFVGYPQDASVFRPSSLTHRPSLFAARAPAYCVSLRVVGQGSLKVRIALFDAHFVLNAICTRELIPSKELSDPYPVFTPLAVYTTPCALHTFHSDCLVDGHKCKSWPLQFLIQTSLCVRATTDQWVRNNSAKLHVMSL